ncbi:MAG: DNA gyrase subunit A [Acidiferrobacterales bacterium]|nr:DNA gyrase subunit A [Acidiferrobacterales bacterium]
MSVIAKKTLIADLENEMRQSYLDYAMSVIVGRALPDIRDGLKPVHRRILYAMHDLRNDWNKPYKKSARITGDVIGKYHPHGDSAIYDAIVRMAQDFSMRYPLIDGQGNFGSIDGDAAAAMRYTEIRLSRLAHELLADIEKDTVDFGPNYDETELQPLVLPTRLPNLLLNGSEGIAVGMATKVPPHNLTETINACLALIDDDGLTTSELMRHMPGPDFPTAGIINGQSGIIEAYTTGRGSIRLRGRVEIEPMKKANRQALIITELPYQILKARLIEQIAELVKAGTLDGISMVRDESDKSGMRIVIELKTGANPEVVENNLYNFTRLESTYGINLVALEHNQPRLFNLKELLNGFIRHRREVVTRKLEFELRKALARAHLLEGQAVALSNIDEMIAIIRESKGGPEARAKLMERPWDPSVVRQLISQNAADGSVRESNNPHVGLTDRGYFLSEEQAVSILQMRLQNLTALEQDKVFDEFREILARIDRTKAILASQELLMKEISDELISMRHEYGKNDSRRTEIVENAMDLNNEDLIEREDVVVTISEAGYAKQQPISEYRSQIRGGRGKTATTHKTDDFVRTMFTANTHDMLLCFTSLGKVYWTKVYRLERAGRTAKGRPLVNVLPALAENERVTAVLPIRDDNGGKFIVMATRKGRIKKCDVHKFSRPRSNGLRALKLMEGDELVNVEFASGDSDILLVSDAARLVRFNENQVRPMGRTAAGVRGIKLESGQELISMLCIEPEDREQVALLVSSDGVGKRTDVSEFPRKSRALKGVYVLPASRRKQVKMIDVQLVNDDDHIMLITDGGTLIRTTASSISKYSRIAAGVRLINLQDDETLVGVAIASDDESDIETDESSSTQVADH